MANESWTVTGPQTIDVDAVGRLDANLLNGRIDVVVHDEPGVRVEVHSIEGAPSRSSSTMTGSRSATRPRAVGRASSTRSATTAAGTGRTSTWACRPCRSQARHRTRRRARRRDAREDQRRHGGRVRHDDADHGRHAHGHRLGRGHGARPHRHPRHGLGLRRLDGVGALRDVKLNTVSGNVTLDSSSTPDAMNVNAVSADVLVRVPEPDELEFALRCVSGRLVVDGIEHRGTPAAPTVRPPGSGSGQEGPGELDLRERHGPAGRGAGRRRVGMPGGDEVPGGPVDATTDAHPGYGARGAPRLGRTRDRRRARGRDGGPLMASVFAHGELRLYLLALLESGPKHGYELMTELSDRFGGTYRPSAGTIYPASPGSRAKGWCVAATAPGRRPTS
ncbi:helix-turn-helix transcriptional regulator [Oerskovia sp. M15]